ncbi:TlpA family protein disulfide reductase [Luteimonas terricola]|nr:TlpA disulfide reductase family protein [Luteimonas terricola]
MHFRHALVACLALLLLAACQREDAQSPASPAPATTPEAGADAAGGDAGTATTLPASPAAAAAQGGAEFPGLVVTTLDGASYDLAERRGRWVVVNFWATWCAPCLKEMPELSALDAMREHVEVIGLAYEDTDPETLRMFLETRPVVYPVAIVDVYDPPRDFPTPRGLPLTCLVAPDGRLVKTFLGPVTAAELEQAIEAAGGPAPGQPG